MYRYRFPLTVSLLIIVAVACGSADQDDDSQPPVDAPDSTVSEAGQMPAPAPIDTVTEPGVDTVGNSPRDRFPAATRPPQPPPDTTGDPIELDPTTAADIEELPQDPVRLLRRTAQIYAAMSGLRADFTMETRNPLLGTRVTSHGELFQRRPDRIRLDFTQPEGDVIVGDGDFFWVYYPSVDPMQVTKTPAAGTAGVVDLQAQFVGDPITRFDHTVEGMEAVDGRDAMIVSLVPRENLGYAKLKVWIDVEDNLVRRFEITDPNGVTRLLDLRSLEIDPRLADTLFRFTPPPGTHVVERG